MTAFTELLAELVASYKGPKNRFARAAGLTPSHLSRLLSGASPPSTDTCLRIAHAAQARPLAVLRAAGHEQIASVIESLFGTEKQGGRRVFSGTVTPSERDRLRAYLSVIRAMNARELEALDFLLHALEPGGHRASHAPQRRFARSVPRVLPVRTGT